jgi:LPXTG-motif cell wall-anchored protein
MMAVFNVAQAVPTTGEDTTTTVETTTVETTTTTVAETTTTTTTVVDSTTTITVEVTVGDGSDSPVPVGTGGDEPVGGSETPQGPPTGTSPGTPPSTDALPALAGAGANTSTVLVTTTVNPHQVDAEQDAVVEATVVADANTGGNVIVDDSGPVGNVSVPAKIDTGAATAVGSSDVNVVTQGANVVLQDQARANVVQVALIINIGLAFANSGFNVVGAAPGGGGTGAISTGNATATGLDIGQYITQGARETGDDDTDASSDQSAVSVWLGVATANSGANTIAGAGGSGSGGSVGAGSATATGNDSLTEVEQYAEILGTGTSVTNITQNTTVLNIGFAVANSGLNDIADLAGGLLTSQSGDDDELTTELFAMLLPAMLQSYGYGPAAGSIDTGDATATGNRSDTFVRQVAMAASSGDGLVDIVQDVLVANVGAASANTGVNSLGSGDVRLLDEESATAVVTMAAFMAELLSMAHHSAGSANLQAQRMGVQIPFQGLILQLDGSFDGLDVAIGDDAGAQANVRQVSIVLSLGIANANSGGNQASTVSASQGNNVNGLAAGSRLAVMAVDEDGNVIGSGDAAAGSGRNVVTVCQRINADDVECLAPPTTTLPPSNPTVPPTTVPGPGTSVAPNVPTTVPPSAPPTTMPGPTTSPLPQGFAPTDILPMTGAETSLPVIVGTLSLLLGTIFVVSTRKRVP